MANLAKIVASIGDAGLVASLGMHLFRDRGQPEQQAPGIEQPPSASAFGPAFSQRKEDEHSTPFERFQKRVQTSAEFSTAPQRSLQTGAGGPGSFAPAWSSSGQINAAQAGGPGGRTRQRFEQGQQVVNQAMLAEELGRAGVPNEQIGAALDPYNAGIPALAEFKKAQTRQQANRDFGSVIGFAERQGAIQPEVVDRLEALRGPEGTRDNPWAVNKKSTAQGPYQLLNPTIKSLSEKYLSEKDRKYITDKGMVEHPKNPKKKVYAAFQKPTRRAQEIYLKMSAALMQEHLNQAPNSTPGQMYLQWNQGSKVAGQVFDTAAAGGTMRDVFNQNPRAQMSLGGESNVFGTVTPNTPAQQVIDYSGQYVDQYNR